LAAQCWRTVLDLIVTRNASIANRGPILIAEADDLADVIITDTSFAAPIRDQFAVRLISPRRAGLNPTPRISAVLPIFTRTITVENMRNHQRFVTFERAARDGGFKQRDRGQLKTESYR
jgi:hypothetical protein